MDEANNPDLKTAMKMNEVEHAFSEWMEQAPQEQRDHFRQMLNVMMQCYGPTPRVALVAGVVDRVQGVLMVHALNLNHDEMQGVVQHMLATVNGDLHGVEAQQQHTEVH